MNCVALFDFSTILAYTIAVINAHGGAVILTQQATGQYWPMWKLSDEWNEKQKNAIKYNRICYICTVLLRVHHISPNTLSLTSSIYRPYHLFCITSMFQLNINSKWCILYARIYNTHIDTSEQWEVKNRRRYFLKCKEYTVFLQRRCATVYFYFWNLFKNKHFVLIDFYL